MHCSERYSSGSSKGKSKTAPGRGTQHFARGVLFLRKLWFGDSVRPRHSGFLFAAIELYPGTPVGSWAVCARLGYVCKSFRSSTLGKSGGNELVRV